MPCLWEKTNYKRSLKEASWIHFNTVCSITSFVIDISKHCNGSVWSVTLQTFYSQHSMLSSETIISSDYPPIFMIRQLDNFVNPERLVKVTSAVNTVNFCNELLWEQERMNGRHSVYISVENIQQPHPSQFYYSYHNCLLTLLLLLISTSSLTERENQISFAFQQLPLNNTDVSFWKIKWGFLL